MNFAVVALIAAVASQTPPSASGFRLGYTQKIYVEDLGSDDAAKLVRNQIIGAILHRSKLHVEGDKSSADVVLSGTAIVTSGSLHWMVGSTSAAATPNSAAASSQVIAGAKTVKITQLGLQLADQDHRILWAFDGGRCLDVQTLLLWGVPRNKTPITCALEQLAKAIDKDAREARSQK